MNLDGLLAALSAIQAELVTVQHAALSEAAEHMAMAAKALVGSEDPSWPALADSTVAYKKSHGYTGQLSGTDPLLRSGQLRDSIEWRVDGATAHIGTDDDAAVVHEHGDDHIPPRPIFGLIAMREGEHTAGIVITAVAKKFAGT